MSSELAAGLALAFASSVGLNLAYVIQHRASLGAPEMSLRRPLAALRVLARRRQWIGAVTLGTLAWGLFIAALWFAPLSLVTAFLAGGLALVIPLARRLLGGEPGATERTATVLMAVALVVLVLGSGDPGAHRSYATAALVGYTVAVAVFALAAVAVARADRGPDALGFAAGAAYGLVDVCTKGLTGPIAAGGIVAAFTSPLLYLFGAFAIAGFAASQRGLQGHRPVPVIALMTSANYVFAILGGLVVFGDPLGAGGGWAAVHVAALAAVVALGFVFASGEARLFAREPAADARRGGAPALHLDLDGAWPPTVLGLPRIDLRSLGPRVRYCARAPDLEALRREGGAGLDARFALLGSGDFHHLTALRLERLSERVTVVAFDNHPDWDIRPPRWACGAWVCRALELPNVERVVIWGCGNYELRLPSRLFAKRSDRLRVIGWEERYDSVPFELVSRGNWMESFERFADDLRGRSAYVTVDLDALATGEATTNWENGLFTAEELAWALRCLSERARVVGGDLCGTWSRPAYARRGQRLLADLDHPDVGDPGPDAASQPALERIWPALTVEANLAPLRALKLQDAESGYAI